MVFLVHYNFIRSYEVIEKVGLVAYRFALPLELEKIHNVFHVSMLRRYMLDPSCNTPKYTQSFSTSLAYFVGII